MSYLHLLHLMDTRYISACLGLYWCSHWRQQMSSVSFKPQLSGTKCFHRDIWLMTIPLGVEGEQQQSSAHKKKKSHLKSAAAIVEISAPIISSFIYSPLKLQHRSSWENSGIYQYDKKNSISKLSKFKILSVSFSVGFQEKWFECCS